MPPLAKSQALILRLTKYGDSGLIVHAVDSVSGRCGYFLQGAGKGRRSAAAAHFHPLNLVNLVVALPASGKMPRIREYEPALRLDSIRTNRTKSAIALFISEVLWRSLRDNDGDRPLFDFLCTAVSALEATEGSAANFHLWFLAGFASRMGFRPENNYAPDRPCFDPAAARYTAPSPMQAAAGLFSAEDSALLHHLFCLPLEEALKLPLTAQRRSAFASRMLDYLSYHLDIRLEIKSMEVLHEVFS